MTKDKNTESVLFEWLKESAKNWCDEPVRRAERTARKKKIADIMGVETPESVKNFYNSGSLKSSRVLDILCEIKGFENEEEFKTFLDAYQFTKDKMDRLPENKLKLLSIISSLSSKEIEALITVLEVGLEANRHLDDDY